MILEELASLFPEKNREIVVGVSGGPDSLALLHFLLENSYNAVAAHFNHGLREGAEQEAQFVARVAAEWGAPWEIRERDVAGYADERGLNLEEASRELRYQFLFSLAKARGAHSVAVGHNANDQVETVLMHILQGTGLQGLSGMARHTLPHAWSEEIPLVRPLLSIWQEEIDQYCREHELRPVLDPTNRDTTYLRNRLRHHLLPVLETYNPQVQHAIWQMAEILRGDFALLRERTERLYREVLQDAGDGYRALALSSLREMDLADQRRLIRKILFDLRPDLDRVTFDQVERARRFLSHPTRSGNINLVGGLGAKIRGNRVYFRGWDSELPLESFPQLPEGQPLSLPEAGTYALESGWVFSLRIIDEIQGAWGRITSNTDPMQAWLDREAVQFPLTLTSRRRGDQLSPLGMEEDHIKVSDLMINEKVPADARKNWPILRSQGRIVWIPGCQIAHFARVTENTTSALHLRAKKKKED